MTKVPSQSEEWLKVWTSSFFSRRRNPHLQVIQCVEIEILSLCHHVSQNLYALYTLPTTDTLYSQINCAYCHASVCNGIICSTHNSLQLRSWDGGLRTLCQYQFLSLPSVPDVCSALIVCRCTKQCTNVCFLQIQNDSPAMHNWRMLKWSTSCTNAICQLVAKVLSCWSAWLSR